MGIYVFRQGRGERELYGEVTFFLPRAHPRVVLSLLSPWLSAGSPFLSLEIALRQEEGEERTSNNKTAALLMEEEDPAGAVGWGPGTGRRPHMGGLASQELLTRSCKRGGRWQGRGGEVGRGLLWGAADSMGYRWCHPLRSRTSSRRGRLGSILPHGGFLLRGILLSFIWFPFSLPHCLRKKGGLLIIARIYK